MKRKILKNYDKIYLFHNNRCSKSKEVKKYLDENHVIYNLIDHLNISLRENFLKKVLLELENNFEEIIRVNEKIYKTLEIDEKHVHLKNMTNLVIKHPILIWRSIVTIQRDNEIVISIICQPTKFIKSIFD